MEKDGELAALAECYLELVYRVALNCVGHPADADDVTQNVMVRFLRACPELESPEHARRWFIRVAVNESRRLLTAPWRRRTVSLEELSAVLPAGREEQAELLEAVLSLPRLYIGCPCTSITMRGTRWRRWGSCWGAGPPPYRPSWPGAGSSCTKN